MLFEKKRTQQMKLMLEEALEQQERRQMQRQEAQTSQINEVLNEAMEKNQKTVRRLSDTVEDFLDTLQEEKDGLRQSQQRIAEAEGREHRLLGLVELYQEQMELMEQWIEGPMQEDSETAQEAWKQQYRMFQEKLATEARLCTIERIGAVGESADYRLHEILQVVEADTEEQEGTIAAVYSHGMLYEGKVIKKARVAAYKKR